MALRARQQELSERGIRLIVVSAGLVEGTITPRLLARIEPSLMEQRFALNDAMPMPTAAEVGGAIAFVGALRRRMGDTIMVEELTSIWRRAR